MVVDTYKEILLLGSSALDDLSQDVVRLRNFTSTHNEIAEFNTLKHLVGGRPEIDMFEKALVEYQRSLAFASTGHYRQANGSLRLFAELALSAVLFSANEIHLRLWLKGQKDINWQSIVCLENGIFSQNFINVFFAELSDYGRQYQAIAVGFYRECSEFIHGNSKSYQAGHQIAFNADLFDEWYGRAESVTRVVKFSYLCRYTLFAEVHTLKQIEAIVLEEFPMVTALQSQFGRPENA
jgi:hypothetical protein